MITLNTPSDGIKKFLKDKLTTILKRKQSNTGIVNRSLSNNIYYINLDDAHLLLMHKTTDNDNVIDNYDVEYDETDTTYYLKFTNDGGTNYVDVPTLYPTATSLDDIYCNVVDCTPDYVDLESVQSIPGEKTFSLQKLNTAINDTGTNKFIVMDGNGQIAPATMTLNDFNVAVGVPPDMSAYVPKDDIFRGTNVFAGGAATGGAYCTTIGKNSKTDKGSATALGSAAEATNSWSIAIGSAAKATGVTSIAIGRIGQAAAENAVAIGQSAQANYFNTLSFGTYSRANKMNTLAMMTESLVTGERGIGIGTLCNVSGERAIAIGSEAQATGENSIAIGHLAHSSGSGGHIAIGYEARVDVNNYNSISLGRKAEALNAYCIAIGHYAQATNSRNIAIGKSTVVTGDNNGGNVGIGNYVNINDGHYNVALGTANPSDGNIAERTLLVNGNNNVAIGRGCQLDCDLGGSIAIGTKVKVENVSNYAMAIGYAAKATTATYGVAIGAHAEATREHNVSIGRYAGRQITSTNIISLHSNSDDSGNARGVFIKSDPGNFRCVVGCKQNETETYLGHNYAMHVVGNLNYTGSLSNTSDERLKTDIKSLNQYSLEDILKLRPVEFKWRERKKEGKQYGFIAQEVEKIIPELVNDNSEYKSLKYTSLIPMLVKCIQEQNDMISDLKKQNEKLETRLNNIENYLM